MKITTKEQESGRKDVHIAVTSLDVNLDDPVNALAKRVIEEKIIPALASKQITVTLIYKPNNNYLSFVAAQSQVRDLTERLVASKGGDKVDYCAVENDGEGRIKVTSLV